MVLRITHHQEVVLRHEETQEEMPALDVEFSLPFMPENKRFYLKHHGDKPSDTHSLEMIKQFLWEPGNEAVLEEVCTAMKAELDYLQQQQKSLQQQMDANQHRISDLIAFDIHR